TKEELAAVVGVIYSTDGASCSGETATLGTRSPERSADVEWLLPTYPARRYLFCLHVRVTGLQVGEFMLKMMLGLALLLAVCVAAGLMLRLPPRSDDDEPRARR
ncbi:MAG: hypothetical protein WBE32_04860, partial [Pseudolabrys sp.]